MAKRRVASVQLFEFNDIEFLSVIRDNADDEGYVFTADLAVDIGLVGDDRNRNCGSRLAWMRRFGMVERDVQPGSPTRGAWRLTEQGEFMLSRKLRESVLKQFRDLDDGELWEVHRVLAEFTPGLNDATYNMCRRTMRIGEYRRRFR